MRRNFWLALLLAVMVRPSSGSAQTTPAIAPSGIVNAASLAAGPANLAAPGALVTIFGSNLATSSGASSASPLPFNINGTVVQIGTTFAPLLYVSPTQINAQVPFEVAPGTVSVVVFVNGRASAPEQLQVRSTAPGIFTVAQNGAGPAQAMHSISSTAVNDNSPAAVSEEIQIVVTGLGSTIALGATPPVATGQRGNGQPVLNVPTVTIGGQAANVVFAGATQGAVGQYFIDVIVPTLTTGDQPIVVTTAGNTTQAAVTVAVSTQVSAPPAGGGPPTPPPTITSSGILNAASLDPSTSGTAAPGELISIFGANLAASTATAGTPPLPQQIGGTTVMIGNIAAPLLLVSPSQINAQVPFEVPTGAPVNVVVAVNGQSSLPASLQVVTAAPGLFTVAGNGSGPAQVFHASGTLVSSASPALPGEAISISCTGLGATLASASLPPAATGQAANGQLTLFTPTVTIGGTSATVTNAVAAPGTVGQYLVTAIVPAALSSGSQTITLSGSGNTSRAAVSMLVGAPGQGVSGGPTAPVIFQGGILNSASLSPAAAPASSSSGSSSSSTGTTSPASSPGGLISIFGNNLATITAAAGPPPLPTSLGGTSVLIGGISAPVLLVSPTQVNAQVPFEIQSGSVVSVVVAVNGQNSAPESLLVASATPGIFTVAGNGAGPAEVFHADGTPVSSTSPAVPGEEVTLYATGLGATLSTATLPAVTDGQAGKGQLTVVTPAITIGGSASSSSSSSSGGSSSSSSSSGSSSSSSSSGTPVNVISSVAAPGLVGQYAIQFIMPNVPAGDQNIIITASGNSSGAATVRVGFLFPQPPTFLQANLAGNFTATFGLTVEVPGPPPVGSSSGSAPPPQLQETAYFAHNISNLGCTIQVSGVTGPSYTGLLHCQDYTDPNNLIAIIVGLQNGQFAGNKLVFTSILNTGISQFFFNGCAISVGGTATPPCTTGAAPQFQWNIPAGALAVSIEGTITSAAVSLDFGPSNFAVGGQVIGTINIAVLLSGSGGAIPGQTFAAGGGIVESIQSVLP